MAEADSSSDSGDEYPPLSYAEAKAMDIVKLRDEMRKRGLLKKDNESKKTLLGRIKYYSGKGRSFPVSPKRKKKSICYVLTLSLSPYIRPQNGVLSLSLSVYSPSKSSKCTVSPMTSPHSLKHTVSPPLSGFKAQNGRRNGGLGVLGASG